MWLRTSRAARERQRRTAEFVVPCQAILSPRAPSGPEWIHEIKHDGYRLIAAKRGRNVRLWTRQAADYTDRFTAIAEAVRGLPVDECMIDGEAVAFNAESYDFHALRSGAGQRSASLIGFDVLDVDGEDMRPRALQDRRAVLAELLDGCGPAVAFSAEIPGDGPEVFAHACAFGLEGIVSKRKGSRYRSGRCVDWMKTKNPAFERP